MCCSLCLHQSILPILDPYYIHNELNKKRNTAVAHAPNQIIYTSEKQITLSQHAGSTHARTAAAINTISNQEGRSAQNVATGMIKSVYSVGCNSATPRHCQALWRCKYCDKLLRACTAYPNTKHPKCPYATCCCRNGKVCKTILYSFRTLAWLPIILPQ